MSVFQRSHLFPSVFVGFNWISGDEGKVSGKLACFFVNSSVGLSISTLVIMSVDRYKAIVHVMKIPISSAATKKFIALSWIASFLVGAPCLYKMDTRESEGGNTVNINQSINQSINSI